MLGRVADKQKRNDLLVVRSKPDDRQTRRLLPTIEAAVELQYAYNFFNERLLGRKLSDCLTANTGSRRKLGTLPVPAAAVSSQMGSL